MQQGFTTNNPSNMANETNAINYFINQKLLEINTVLPCKILEIKELRLTIQPIITMLDAQGKPHQYPIIYNVPFMQVRGGNAGIIIEYVVGDVVAVGFCQRDISLVKEQWDTSNPASLRKLSITDAIVLGILSNTQPTIFIKINKDGIQLQAKELPIMVECQQCDIKSDAITLKADNIKLDGDVNITGSLTIEDKLYSEHIHQSGTLVAGTTPVSGSTGTI